MDPHDVAFLLDELENIAVRSGVHCAEPLHARLGLSGTVRASFYIYNTMEEIDLLCDTIDRVVDLLA
jgi:cysteine desulfurase/selenocysteine lyase